MGERLQRQKFKQPNAERRTPNAERSLYGEFSCVFQDEWRIRKSVRPSCPNAFNVERQNRAAQRWAFASRRAYASASTS